LKATRQRLAGRLWAGRESGGYQVKCVDCGEDINPEDFPEFVTSERAKNAKRCAKCALLALWDLILEIDEEDEEAASD
jgi:hypothetical protein